MNRSEVNPVDQSAISIFEFQMQVKTRKRIKRESSKSPSSDAGLEMHGQIPDFY